jgi:hypothetical protein
LKTLVGFSINLRDGIGRSQDELALETVSGTFFVDHRLPYRNIVSAQKSGSPCEGKLTKNMGPLP